jgi:hypothetical protein
MKPQLNSSHFWDWIFYLVKVLPKMEKLSDGQKSDLSQVKIIFLLMIDTSILDRFSVSPVEL